VSGPAAIPPEAVQSAAEALRNEGTQGQLEALAAIVLEAAEAVWPHAPPQRDPASTTAATVERALQLADDILQAFVRTSDGYRARAGGVQIRKWEAALLELKDRRPQS